MSTIEVNSAQARADLALSALQHQKRVAIEHYVVRRVVGVVERYERRGAKRVTCKYESTQTHTVEKGAKRAGNDGCGKGVQYFLRRGKAADAPVTTKLVVSCRLSRSANRSA